MVTTVITERLFSPFKPLKPGFHVSLFYNISRNFDAQISRQTDLLNKRKKYFSIITMV